MIIVEPGVHADRQRRGAHPDPGARASSPAGWRRDGWEVRIEPIPGQFVHIDVLVSILAPKLAAVCVESASGGLVAWLRDKGFEILEVSTADAFKLGVNAISLGDERVISTAGSAELNEQMRSLGLEVFDPDLAMFTLGRRRRPLPRPGAAARARRLSRGGAGDRRRPGDRRPARARAADRRTSAAPSALCWSPSLARRRARCLGELLAEIGLEPEIDEAGNLWARLEGADRDAPGAGARLAPRLGPRRRLARRRARRDGGARGPARLGGRRRARRRATSCSSTGPTRRARASAAACSAARPSPGTLDPAELDGAARRRRRARSPRSSPRTASSSPRAGECARRRERPRRLPRAPHRAGARCSRREGLRGGRGHRLRRGRAAALRVRRPGRPRRHDADGRAPRRRPRGRRGGAGDRARSRRPRAGSRPPASCGSSRGSPPRSPGAAMLGRRPAPPRGRAARRGCSRRPAPLRASRPRRRGCELARAAGLADRADRLRPRPRRSPRAPPAPRSPASRRASRAARFTTPPRSPGCCPAAMIFAPSRGGHQPRPRGGHRRGRPAGGDRGLRGACPEDPGRRHVGAGRGGVTVLAAHSHVACTKYTSVLQVV